MEESGTELATKEVIKINDWVYRQQKSLSLIDEKIFLRWNKQ
jgi:hypothetical protein